MYSKVDLCTLLGINYRDSQDRWEEKEIERLRKRKSDLENQLADSKRLAPSRQLIVELDTRLRTLQAKLQYSEADKAVALEKIEQLRQQQSLKEDNIKGLNKEIAALKKVFL